MCKSAKVKPTKAMGSTDSEAKEVGAIPSNACSTGLCQLQSTDSRGTVRVPHWMYEKITGWRKGDPADHPKLSVNIKLAVEGYNAAGVQLPGIKITNNKQIVDIRQSPFTGISDTGAQTTCAGMSLVRALGLKKENLIPVRMS